MFSWKCVIKYVDVAIIRGHLWSDMNDQKCVWFNGVEKSGIACDEWHGCVHIWHGLCSDGQFLCMRGWQAGMQSCMAESCLGRCQCVCKLVLRSLTGKTDCKESSCAPLGMSARVPVVLSVNRKTRRFWNHTGPSLRMFLYCGVGWK